MNAISPISSNNNINEDNLQEELAFAVQSFSGIRDGKRIDLIRNEKETSNEEEIRTKSDSQEEYNFANDQEVTQEEKDLFSNIQSTAKVININSIKDLNSAPSQYLEVEGEQKLCFKGYEILHGKGKGGQAKVLRVRKENFPNLAIKCYERSKEKEFRREASILKDLRWSPGGGVGILEFVISPTHYGIVIDNGVCSLHNFREFLIDNNLKLTEDELLMICKALRRNYKAVRSISVLHRDIKPANIILHQNDFNLEIIDYGLADYDYSRSSWRGGVGTKGFSKPDLMDDQKSFTKEELLKGDYYTIMTTMLFMADLKFKPRETKPEKEIESSFKRISKFKTLHEILKALQEGRDIIEDEIGSKVPDFPRGYESGLSKYKDDFLGYMQKRADKDDLSCQEETKAIEKTVIDCEKEFSSAAEHYLKHNQREKALNCYELIIKTYIKAIKQSQFQYRYQDAQPFFEKICSIMDFKNPDFCEPLLFSTLGIYSYLIHDFEGAKFFLRTGIENSKEISSMLILLSNYENLCSERGCCQNDHTIHEKIYSLLKSTREDFFENKTFIKVWKEIRSSYRRDLVRISSEKEDRKYEFVLTPCTFEEGINDDEKLFFMAFISLCESRSAMLVHLLEENHKDLVLEINYLCSCWSSKYFEKISFQPSLEANLEVFSILTQFNDILQSYQKWDANYKEIKELKEASDLFEKNKNEMRKLFGGETSGNLFRIFCRNNLLIALTGFILKSSGSRPERKKASAFISDDFKRKFHFLLQNTDSIEIRFPKTGMYNSDPWDSFSVLRDFFESDFVSNPQMGDIDFLKKMQTTLLDFHYQVESDTSSKSKKYKVTLSHLTIVYQTDLWNYVESPLVPENIQLESLYFILKDAKIFETEEMVLEEIQSHKSLLKFSANFLRSVSKSHYFDDWWSEYLAKFIGSLERLRSLTITIRDGLLTEEGIHFLEEALKGLSDLESMEFVFITCPMIADESIESLVGTIEKTSKIANLILKFEGCMNISMELDKKLKNKMNSGLKEKAIILVKPR